MKIKIFSRISCLKNELYVRSASIQPYMNEYTYFNEELEKVLANNLNEKNTIKRKRNSKHSK